MMAPTVLLAATLTAIEAADQDYETRYGLVVQAMHLAQLAGLETGIASTRPRDRTGQISWHMPAHPHAYDGHTTDAKYRRCQQYALLVGATW